MNKLALAFLGLLASVAPVCAQGVAPLIQPSQLMAKPPLDPRAAPFNAKCDGTTDDSVALQAWATAFTNNTNARVPGICAFKTPIVFPHGVNYVNLFGGELLYTGSSTTITALTIGAIEQGSCQNTGWNIHDLTIFSSTAMTAGSGLL